MSAVSLAVCISPSVSAADDIIIPIQSIWGVLADAFDDAWFWFFFLTGTSLIALAVRYRLKKVLRTCGGK